MTTTEGQARARRTAQDRMSDLKMNLADVAREAGVDVKSARSFLQGERWPQKKTRAAISLALGWPANFVDRLAEGDLDTEDALAHVLIGGEHAPYPSPKDGMAMRLNGVDRHIDALYARVERLEELLQQGGDGDDQDDDDRGAAPTRSPSPDDEGPGSVAASLPTIGQRERRVGQPIRRAARKDDEK